MLKSVFKLGIFMNIAVIFAGGSGQRMHTNGIPKQFLSVFGKPILVWTLEKFQNCMDIDQIVLVVIESYLKETKTLMDKYNLSKVIDVVPGGKTGQESIFIGVKRAVELNQDDGHIVLIHDGVRPFINDELIHDCIESVRQHGSAISVSPAIETVVKLDKDKQIQSIYDRSTCYNAKAPQCFYLTDLYNAHIKAIQDNKDDFIDSASLMKYYNYDLYTVLTNTDNIKITTSKDYYCMKALIQAHENMQILGL